MKNQKQKTTLIIVNEKAKPSYCIDNKLLHDYAAFILIDPDLERVNELALILERHNKLVYILREIDELPTVLERTNTRLFAEAITVHVSPGCSFFPCNRACNAGTIRIE